LRCWFWWTQGTIIRWGPDPNGKGHFWGRMMWIFFHTLPSTVPSRPDVGISPHAVDQRSDWPAAEVVECHIKLSQWKMSPCDMLHRWGWNCQSTAKNCNQKWKFATGNRN